MQAAMVYFSFTIHLLAVPYTEKHMCLCTAASEVLTVLSHVLLHLQLLQSSAGPHQTCARVCQIANLLA